MHKEQSLSGALSKAALAVMGRPVLQGRLSPRLRRPAHAQGMRQKGLASSYHALRVTPEFREKKKQSSLFYLRSRPGQAYLRIAPADNDGARNNSRASSRRSKHKQKEEEARREAERSRGEKDSCGAVMHKRLYAIVR